MTLRLCLSAMYDEIIRSPDQIYTKSIKLSQLVKAIDDLHKSMDSHKVMKNKFLTSKKIVLRTDFSNLIGAIPAGYGIYEGMIILEYPHLFPCFLLH